MLHPLYRVPVLEESPKPYGFWARTSSDKQRREHTIEGQLEEWFTYCKKEGIDPHTEVHYFLDEGVSGSIPIWQRPNGAIMQRYIQGGYVTEYIITMYIDRVARDHVGSVPDVMDECERYGINFLAVNDNIDTANEGADTHAGLSAVLARMGKKNQLKRMAAGKMRKARQGYWISGKCPYGHMTSPDNRLTLDPAQAQTVLLFRDLVKVQNMSKRALAKYANAQGIPTSTGRGAWTHAAIHNILSSTSLYGEAVYNKIRDIRRHTGRITYAKPQEDHVVVPCPPILSKAEWEDLQHALIANSRIYQHTGQHIANTMLSNMFCAECGGRYYGQVKRVGVHTYFIYRHAWQPTKYDSKHKDCPQRCYFRADGEGNADAKIWAMFLADVANIEAWEASLSKLSDAHSIDRLALAKAAAYEAEKALADLDHSFWRSRQLTRPQYDRLLPALQHDVERTAEALIRAQTEAATENSRGARIQHLSERLRQMQGVLDAAPLALRREILEEMLERVECDHREFRLIYAV